MSTITALKTLNATSIGNKVTTNSITPSNVANALDAVADELLARGIKSVDNVAALAGVSGTDFKAVFVKNVGLFNYSASGTADALKTFAASGAGFFVRSDNDLIRITRGSYTDFILVNRLNALGFPVVTLKPDSPSGNKNLAFDLMPNGTPGNYFNEGIVWMDICDTNVQPGAGAVGAARVGITEDAVQFGSKAFDGATLKPIEIILDEEVMLKINTDDTAEFNLSKITQSKSLTGDFVGLTMLNTNNAVVDSDVLIFLGNDIGASRFGFVRWSNSATVESARLPDALELTSAGSGGLHLASISFGAPIRFVQNFGGSNNAEVARFTAGRLGIGTIANAAAILDLSSTNKGLLLPRMTKVQRDAIASPIAGLSVYQTDNTPGLRVYNGTNWMKYTETAD